MAETASKEESKQKFLEFQKEKNMKCSERGVYMRKSSVVFSETQRKDKDT